MYSIVRQGLQLHGVRRFFPMGGMVGWLRSLIAWSVLRKYYTLIFVIDLPGGELNESERGGGGRGLG